MKPCEAVVRFLSRTGTIQRHRGRAHQAAGDDHRVSTTTTNDFTGAQIASDAHQIVVRAAIERRRCRVATDEQAVGTAVYTAEAEAEATLT